MIRWVAGISIVIVVVLAAVIAAAAFVLPGVNLASLAAGRASAMLGRAVTLQTLYLTPRRWIRFELSGLHVANVPGGSAPDFIAAETVSGEVNAWTLLHGPIVVRGVKLVGASVLAERTAEHRANWQTGGARPNPAAARPDQRSGFPVLLDVDARDTAVTYRTAHGATYRVRLDNLALSANDAEAPIRLTASGRYNDVPVSIDGDLQPFSVFNDASVPFGAEVRLASSDTALTFRGTLKEPLDVDGVHGAVRLQAPTLDAILAIGGLKTDVDVSAELSGTFDHNGDDWALTSAKGAFQGNPIASGTLTLAEGSKGQPDDVAVNLDFERLDLNSFLGSTKRGGPAAKQDADVPLDIDRAPSTLLHARLGAKALSYGAMRFSEATIDAGLTPGKVAVRGLVLTYLGAQMRASGQIVAADKGNGRVTLDVGVTGADVQQFRKAMGFGAVPLSGRLDAQFRATATGQTLNAATRNAEVAAALSMTSGGIGREVVSQASTDIRLLFNKPTGLSPISCLLAVLNMRAGIGTVLPLRVRAADGVIAGNAQFDLNKKTFDLTIASQPSTTSFFALDVPVRIFGSFSNPTIRPAAWSKEGRQLLARTDYVQKMPPDIQQFARRNPCAEPSGTGTPR